MVGCVGFGPESGDMLRGPDEETEVPWLWKWWLRAMIAGRRPKSIIDVMGIRRKKKLRKVPVRVHVNPLVQAR